ncbi:MAG: hypothetical protein IM613_18445, partial [Cytophagales bacterium]|nr:hypothetical protein [Cytophagales bacterium]MCA6392268.1 hypothetical protein [Cytophagales bacterium]MCA6417568.1 hypothetical protein [Cytophagales bacterium]MCA6431418.1 hypothetical protein [Cytophagales bacterium]
MGTRTTNITDGNITDAKISSSGITTAGKVSGSTITSGTINPNYALGMHSLPRGLTIRLRRMSRLNLVTLAVRVRHLSSDLTMKIT